MSGNIVAEEVRPAKRVTASELSPAPVHRTIWSRYSTLINFWLDALLLVLFVIQAWILAVLRFVFPRGAGSEWTVWGGTPADWSDSMFIVFCAFAVAVILHVMFHWAWICGVISTRFLGRKPGKDDGTQTLIGVGLLVFLIHLVIAGILAAKMGLVVTH